MINPFKKILLIDDDEHVLQATKRFLELRGYDVTTAPTGLAALKQLEMQNGFDLIVTDLIMPDVSGFGVISMVKNECPSMPVIAITGWGEIPEKLASEVKADAILKKPFELIELEETIQNVLSKARTGDRTEETP